jgi:hypothetical protein
VQQGSRAGSRGQVIYDSNTTAALPPLSILSASTPHQLICVPERSARRPAIAQTINKLTCAPCCIVLAGTRHTTTAT